MSRLQESLDELGPKLGAEAAPEPAPGVEPGIVNMIIRDDAEALTNARSCVAALDGARGLHSVWDDIALDAMGEAERRLKRAVFAITFAEGEPPAGEWEPAAVITGGSPSYLVAVTPGLGPNGGRSYDAGDADVFVLDMGNVETVGGN